MGEAFCITVFKSPVAVFKLDGGEGGSRIICLRRSDQLLFCACEGILAEPSGDFRRCKFTCENLSNIYAAHTELHLGKHIIKREQRGHGGVAQNAIVLIAFERAVCAVGKRHL